MPPASGPVRFLPKTTTAHPIHPMMTAHELDTILDDARDDFRGVMHRLHRHILEAAAAALDDAWEEEQGKERRRQARHTGPADPPEAQLPLFAESCELHPSPPPSLSLAALLSGPPPAGGKGDTGGIGIGNGFGGRIGMDSIPASASMPVPLPLPAFAPATLADFMPGAPPAKPARTSARASKGPKVMVTAKITLDLSQSPPSWQIEASVGTRRRAQGQVRH
ncbi:MAG: hypothetical protein EOP86_24995 [Verrucomicrobiaceae bacterium]|nr:MAG: hypothetical protein EOP86_24995 [Verrucomicrobiaceae bacterium]